MPIKIQKSEKRTFTQLQEHYEIEKELANRLRNASRERRRYLYTALYDEFYRRVLCHPHLIRKIDSKYRIAAVSKQIRFLKRFVNPESKFLELGAGDCSLSLQMSKYVRKVYAIDVSKEISKNNVFPQNCEVIISDGCSIPVSENSIDIAYSNQLMEHLHPDDAFDQLQNIYKALIPGGKYICITPNRLSGPEDISKYFDEVATGFHLREYTVTELCILFRKAGFSKIGVYIGAKGFYMKFMLSLVILLEKLISILPFPLRKVIGRTLPFKQLLHIRIVGAK